MDERIRRIATQYARDSHEEELELLRRLARIPAPSHHEGRRATFVHDWLLEQGADPDELYVDDAGNVVLRLGDPGAHECAIFSAHMDVVFPDEEELPLSEDERRMYAPGIGDDTANLVALLMAARYLVRNRVPLDCRVLVVADACEEGLGNLDGTKALFRRLAGRMLVREFTSFDLYLGMHVTSAVGSHRWRVRVTTEGGHSWEDFGRDNAIESLCSFIEDLYALELPTQAKTTVNVGRFVGGTTVNSIAEEASVLVEYRSACQECLEEMYAKFVVLVERHLREGARVHVELIGRRPASGEEVPDGQLALVARADEAIAELGGVQPVHKESSTDANVALSMGIPAHTVGTVVGDLLHTREEWVDKASLRRGLAVVMALMLSHATELPEGA